MESNVGPPKKKSVIILFLISVITWGIYPGFWYLRRIKEFRALNTTKRVGKGLVIVYIILTFFLYAVIGLYAGFDIKTISPSETILFILALFPLFVIFILLLLWIAISFRARKIINEALENKGTETKISGFYTLIFNLFYLQYEINRINEDKEDKKRRGPLIWLIIIVLVIVAAAIIISVDPSYVAKIKTLF